MSTTQQEQQNKLQNLLKYLLFLTPKLLDILKIEKRRIGHFRRMVFGRFFLLLRLRKIANIRKKNLDAEISSRK